MRIMVKRTKLFDDGFKGEAPKGSFHTFDICQSYAFKAKYEYMNKIHYPEYAQNMVDRWNRQQPTNWKYEIVSIEYN